MPRVRVGSDGAAATRVSLAGAVGHAGEGVGGGRGIRRIDEDAAREVVRIGRVRRVAAA